MKFYVESERRPARCTLKQLRTRHGFQDESNEFQDEHVVLAMGRLERWKRISGRGESAEFELQPKGETP